MIDVIIPSYNSSKTIERTIMSLAIQRLSKQLHITIVDDCSTDGYDYNDIVRKYFKFFADIKIITLEENHGVGYARQVGIDNTTSPWIYFIDSDDIMTQCYAFNRMVLPIAKHGTLDLVYTNCIQETFPSFNDPLFNPSSATFTDQNGKLQYLHGKRYSREFIKQNGLTIPPLRSNEDIAFNMACFTLCDPSRVVHIDFSTVVTICNKNSITRNTKSTRLFTITNVNENHDSYRACLHSFKEVSRKLGNSVSPTTCKHFIQKYVNNWLNGLLGDFDSPEDQELYQMITTLYYRDIVKPIMTANGIPRHLNDDVICSNPFNYWGDEQLEKVSLPHIHEWSEEALNSFNQEIFDALSKEKLTEVGYIG